MLAGSGGGRAVGKRRIALGFNHEAAYNDQYDHADKYGDTMSTTISAVEARKKFGEMLNRVALRQEEIIIERAGKQLAKLSPIDEKQPNQSGKLDFRKAAGLGKGMWQAIDIEVYLKQERGSWE